MFKWASWNQAGTLQGLPLHLLVKKKVQYKYILNCFHLAPLSLPFKQYNEMQVIKYLHTHLLSTQLQWEDKRDCQVYLHIQLLQSLHTSTKLKYLNLNLNFVLAIHTNYGTSVWVCLGDGEWHLTFQPSYSETKSFWKDGQSNQLPLCLKEGYLHYLGLRHSLRNYYRMVSWF